MCLTTSASGKDVTKIGGEKEKYAQLHMVSVRGGRDSPRVTLAFNLFEDFEFAFYDDQP